VRASLRVVVFDAEQLAGTRVTATLLAGEVVSGDP
jgi:hypothetical protein